MKTRQIINWLTISLAFLGILFKMTHKAEADFILFITLVVLFTSTLFAFSSNKQNGMGDLLNYTLTLLLLLLVTSGAFFILRWPGSESFLTIRSVIIMILPVIMLIANKENKVSNSYWVTFLTYTMLILSMISLKEDSFFL